MKMWKSYKYKCLIFCHVNERIIYILLLLIKNLISYNIYDMCVLFFDVIMSRKFFFLKIGVQIFRKIIIIIIIVYTFYNNSNKS